MDLHIKTFRLHSASDERALNDFLAGKIVRHWATSFTQADGQQSSTPASTGAEGGPDTLADATSSSNGTWNVMIAYEIRMGEVKGGRQDREAGSRRTHDGRTMDGRGDGRNQDNRGNDRDGKGNGRPERKEEKREKPVREDYQPQIPAGDVPLFEAVRKWRNARAREERVKPFEFFNNRTLEELVKAKPSDAGQMKSLVPEMEARLWDRYHNELLGFMDAAHHGSDSHVADHHGPESHASVSSTSGSDTPVEASALEAPSEASAE